MYSMKKMEIPDPLGYDWTEQWAKSLSVHSEFREINDWYRSFYPEFAILVDRFLLEPACAQNNSRAGKTQ